MNIPAFLLDLLTFWFIDGPKGLINYFSSFNTAFLKLFSFQILTRTYFKPWKNEYRQGLVGFSIGMGIIIKSLLLLFDLLLLVMFLLIEIFIVIAFILWPFITIGILFIKF